MGTQIVALTVACCLWGDFPDTGWSERYVERLKNGVARNLSRSFDFVCFADREIDIEGVEHRPLHAHSWLGNLPKTYIYSPDAGLAGRVLLFDLDNVIVGSLDDMAAYDGPLCVRGRLQHGKNREPDGDMIAFEAGSEMAQHLWAKANDASIERVTEGREREFILWAAPGCDQWQDVCPGQVVSYRHHCRGRLPDNARVVSMHGRPRPHQVSDKFIVENWR